MLAVKQSWTRAAKLCVHDFVKVRKMIGKITRYLYQTVRFFRSSIASTESRHRRSNCKSNEITSSNLTTLNQQSIEQTESAASLESTESFETARSTIESTESTDSTMTRTVEFDELCKEFEIRIENSVRLVKDKVQIKSKEIDEVIVIDDDIEQEFTNLINKKRNETKRETKAVKLFANLTNRIQNVEQHRPADEPTKLKELKSINNLAKADENKASKEVKESKESLKETFKKLKPENYRIQQVIKEEDLVFFDLETGGMGSKQDILQIGAINHEGRQFNMYATPTQPIPGMSSRIHHITFKDNQMCYRKNPVKHRSIVEVLLQFCEYLNQTKSNNIVLVAHNANFDRRFLIEKMFLHDLQGRLNAKLVGFIDTLPLFRQLIPGKESYKQDRLVLSYFPQTKTDFHNALTDVIYLKKLFQKVAIARMKNEFKFINAFTQSLEYAFLKKGLFVIFIQILKLN